MTRSATALVNKEMLVWARQSAGMRSDDAAHKLQISEEKLRAWESGTERPTVKQLLRVATVYKQSFAAFYLPKAPAIFQPPVRDYRRLPGDAPHIVSSDLAIDMRFALDRREIYLELLQNHGRQPKQFQAQATIQKNPESLAAEIRELLSVGVEVQKRWRDERVAFLWWREAVENSGALVFQSAKIPLDEMRGYSLAVFPLPVIVVNRKDTHTGRVFTLLHEFVHVLLRSGGVCDLDAGLGRPPEEQAVEVFCNRVSGATLVPRDDLLSQSEVRTHQGTTWDDSDLKELAKRYCVSREVILRRLLTLQLTSQEFYEQKRIEFAAQYERRKSIEGFVPPYTDVVSLAGKSFVRLVLESLHEDRITTSDASDYLGLRLKHLHRIGEAVGME